MATRRTSGSETTGEEAIKRLVGRNIAAARLEREWTQSDLAQQSGLLDPQQISKWERAVYKPSGEALQALAAALGRDLAWFFADHSAEAAAA